MFGRMGGTIHVVALLIVIMKDHTIHNNGYQLSAQNSLHDPNTNVSPPIHPLNLIQVYSLSRLLIRRPMARNDYKQRLRLHSYHKYNTKCIAA